MKGAFQMNLKDKVKNVKAKVQGRMDQGNEMMKEVADTLLQEAKDGNCYNRACGAGLGAIGGAIFGGPVGAGLCALIGAVIGAEFDSDKD
jgi:hypothetical protein